MIKKEEFRNMVIVNVALWMFVILIAKVFNPQFVSLRGMLSAVFKGEIMVSFYLIGVIFFASLSYILFLCGLYIVYDETVSKLIRVVKLLFGYDDFREAYNYYIRSEQYTKRDVLLIAIYTFVALPSMLFLMWPTLVAVLILIFISYCIFTVGK